MGQFCARIYSCATFCGSPLYGPVFYSRILQISESVGFPPKLISTFDEIFVVEIIASNRNFDFDGRNRNSEKQSK
jgi:hypothetical protein